MAERNERDAGSEQPAGGYPDTAADVTAGSALGGAIGPGTTGSSSYGDSGGGAMGETTGGTHAGTSGGGTGRSGGAGDLGMPASEADEPMLARGGDAARSDVGGIQGGADTAEPRMSGGGAPGQRDALERDENEANEERRDDDVGGQERTDLDVPGGTVAGGPTGTEDFDDLGTSR